jgi:O-acetyl-ADP-ribose deacetylase (regulator of RNase III)
LGIPGGKGMAEKTRIFVCHKKLNADGSENNSAYQLSTFLSEVADYEVWIDDSLKEGALWAKTIYRKLLPAHVVILVLNDQTAESEWVRQEISLAVAFGIQIIPLGLDIDEKQLQDQLHKLKLAPVHYGRPFNISSQTAKAIVARLTLAIREARAATESGGFKLLKDIGEEIRPRAVPARPNISVKDRSFTFGTKKISVHVTTGDIFRLSNYQILVNSENDYMQMARVFDSKSISSQIRYDGGPREDAIQAEIESAFRNGRYTRPVPVSTAIVTSSGGKESKLYPKGISHIIHVAAVKTDLDARKIAALTDEEKIRDCVASALSAAQDICRAQGVVSPEGTPQRQLQEANKAQFAPTRIMMPLFGTGTGGKSVAEVGPVVLDAILEFFVSPLYEEKDMGLTDFHVSVFLEDDVPAIVNALTRLEARQ